MTSRISALLSALALTIGLAAPAPSYAGSGGTVSGQATFDYNYGTPEDGLLSVTINAVGIAQAAPIIGYPETGAGTAALIFTPRGSTTPEPEIDVALRCASVYRSTGETGKAGEIWDDRYFHAEGVGSNGSFYNIFVTDLGLDDSTGYHSQENLWVDSPALPDDVGCAHWPLTQAYYILSGHIDVTAAP